jgi:uncharacterized protein (TIGR03086 family)
MDPIDFRPATDHVAAVVRGIRDDQLAGPTPCPDWSVGDLLDHLHGLALAFTWAATKSAPPGGASPSANSSALPDDWRDAIVARLDALASAWDDPAAYAGLTMAGPIEMPAEIAVLVALDEVVVHGWDLATATGQPYDPDEEPVRLSLDFALGFEVPEGAGEGPFGAARPVPADAPALHRLAGATGRDPAWSPAT